MCSKLACNLSSASTIARRAWPVPAIRRGALHAWRQRASLPAPAPPCPCRSASRCGSGDRWPNVPVRRDRGSQGRRASPRNSAGGCRAYWRFRLIASGILLKQQQHRKLRRRRRRQSGTQRIHRSAIAHRETAGLHSDTPVRSCPPSPARKNVNALLSEFPGTCGNYQHLKHALHLLRPLIKLL
jgi:hypothetical protein